MYHRHAQSSIILLCALEVVMGVVQSVESDLDHYPKRRIYSRLPLWRYKVKPGIQQRHFCRTGEDKDPIGPFGVRIAAFYSNADIVTSLSTVQLSYGPPTVCYDLLYGLGNQQKENSDA